MNSDRLKYANPFMASFVFEGLSNRNRLFSRNNPARANFQQIIQSITVSIIDFRHFPRQQTGKWLKDNSAVAHHSSMIGLYRRTTSEFVLFSAQNGKDEKRAGGKRTKMRRMTLPRRHKPKRWKYWIGYLFVCPCSVPALGSIPKISIFFLLAPIVVVTRSMRWDGHETDRFSAGSILRLASELGNASLLIDVSAPASILLFSVFPASGKVLKPSASVSVCFHCLWQDSTCANLSTFVFIWRRKSRNRVTLIRIYRLLRLAKLPSRACRFRATCSRNRITAATRDAQGAAVCSRFTSSNLRPTNQYRPPLKIEIKPIRV